jgi:sodium transport system permease protein
MSIWTLIKVVAHKELLDGFRDRRALMSALTFPLLGPLMITVMLSVVTSEEEIEGSLEVPVVGVEYAPNLIRFLEEQGVVLEDPTEEMVSDPHEVVRRGDEAVILSIDEDFADHFQEGTPARITMVADKSKRSTQVATGRLSSLLGAYNARMVQLRLLTRGVSPQILRSLDVHQEDLATPQTRASNILEMIGMFLIMAAFGCNMYIAIDATAGERERGSLEPLLLQPVSSGILVMGKWLSTVVFGVLGGVLTLLCLTVAMHQLPLENLGLRLVLGPMEAMKMLVIAFPLILFAGAAQLLLATIAKSFKEAQTYLSATMLLPMLPGLFASMKPMEPSLWMSTVPALGQQVMTSMVLRGEDISISYWGCSTGVCFVLTVLCLMIMTRVLGSEYLFRKGS